MKKLSFALAFSLLCVASVFAQWNSNTIKGEGPMVTKTLTLDKFQGIGLGMSATVNLYHGDQKVTIEAQQNIIDNLNMDIKDGSWSIQGKKDVKFKNYEDIVINITLPTVNELSIGGTGNIIGHDAFTGLNSLDMSIGGSGNIQMAGSADRVSISIAGSGKVEAKALNAKTCEVSIAGSGDAYVDVNDKLDVSIAGSGGVKYSGSPKISSSVAGSGRISSVD